MGGFDVVVLGVEFAFKSFFFQLGGVGWDL